MPTSWQQHIDNDPKINLGSALTLDVNTHMYLTALTQTEILTIDADLQKANDLMQGQFTCDLNQLSEKNSLLGACCNPQGRILATFRIFQYKGNYHLSMPQGTAEQLKAHLDKFAMFYRATLTINAEIKALALIGTPANHYITEHFGTLNATLQQVNKNGITMIQAPGKHRYEVYGQENDLTPWLNNSTFDTAPALNWYQGNIEASIAEITPDLSGQLLPHDLSLDKTNIIDFNKGCYSGQEIIARMHYRGTPKRSGFIIHWQGHSANPGDIIYGDNKKKAGVIINSIKLEHGRNIAFCSLNHQQLESTLTIHQCPLQVNIPASD